MRNAIANNVRRVAALVAFVSALFAAGANASNGAVEVGDWLVSAQAFESPVVGYCRMRTVSAGGTTLVLVSRTSDRLEMLLSNPTWRIAANAPTTVALQFENGFEAHADFTRAAATMWLVELDTRTDRAAHGRLLSAFRESPRVRITMGDRSVHDFWIRGATPALSVFAECNKQWAGRNVAGATPPDLAAILAAAVAPPARRASTPRARANAPEAAAEAAPAAPAAAAAPTERARPARRQSAGSAGSAFAITADGVLVTNLHVVEACVSGAARPQMHLRDAWVDTPVLATSAADDLALLAAPASARPLPHLRIANRPARLGESAYVFGFPLTGLLSDSGNFTQGSISALAGLRSDARSLQFSAPVQPGNSGGPLVDETGQIVGIVVAKLNATRVSRATGDIPQNVNFAVKASALVELAQANSIALERAGPGRKMAATDIAARLTETTFRVRCRA